MSSLPPPPPDSSLPGSLPPPPPNDPVNVRPPVAPSTSPARKGRRISAAIVDVIVMVIFYVVIGIGWVIVMLGVNGDDGYSVYGISRVVPAVPWMLFSALFFKRSASVGKLANGLVVVDAQTSKPATFVQMIRREWVGKILLGMLTGGLTVLIGAIMFLVNPTGRSLWDIVARTTVVERR